MSPDRRPRAAGRARPAVFESGSNSDPFQILAAEHALIRLHLARILDAARRADHGAQTREALTAFAASFQVHERREDVVLYPMCEQLFGGRDSVAAVLREDHEAIRRTVDDLLAAPVWSGPVPFDALDRLHGLVEDHFGKEERVLFPLMTAHLPGKESARLARRLRAASSG